MSGVSRTLGLILFGHIKLIKSDSKYFFSLLQKIIFKINDLKPGKKGFTVSNNYMAVIHYKQYIKAGQLFTTLITKYTFLEHQISILE